MWLWFVENRRKYKLFPLPVTINILHISKPKLNFFWENFPSWVFSCFSKFHPKVPHRRMAFLKGTVSRDGWWHVWLVLGLNRDLAIFLIFMYFNDFIKQKVYFSQLMRVYVGLIILEACTQSRFPCFLLVGWVSSGIGPCFPLAGGLCKLYANARGKWQIQRQPLLVHKVPGATLIQAQNYPFMSSKAQSSSWDSPFNAILRKLDVYKNFPSIYLIIIFMQEPPAMAPDRGGNQAKREAGGERNRARGLLIIRC